MNQIVASRTAGLAGLAFIATGFLGLSGPYFDNPGNDEILSWVHAHPGTICVEAMQAGMGPVLVAVVVAGLVVRAGWRTPLAVAALLAMAAMIAVDWVVAGLDFALADAGRRDGADQAVIALFTVSKDMTFADGFLFGIASLSVSALCLRRRALPTVLAWLGIVVGVFHLLELPVQIAATQRPDGVAGPIGVVLGLAWLLATSVVLLVRPRADTRAVTADPAAATV